MLLMCYNDQSRSCDSFEDVLTIQTELFYLLRFETLLIYYFLTLKLFLLLIIKQTMSTSLNVISQNYNIA